MLRLLENYIPTFPKVISSNLNNRCLNKRPETRNCPRPYAHAIKKVVQIRGLEVDYALLHPLSTLSNLLWRKSLLASPPRRVYKANEELMVMRTMLINPIEPKWRRRLVTLYDLQKA